MAKLKSTVNSSRIEKEIITCFSLSDNCTDPNTDYQTDFEHGQWWVTNPQTGRQWSVVDAVDGKSIGGFDFEVVSEGDE